MLLWGERKEWGIKAEECVFALAFCLVTIIFIGRIRPIESHSSSSFLLCIAHSHPIILSSLPLSLLSLFCPPINHGSASSVNFNSHHGRRRPIVSRSAHIRLFFFLHCSYCTTTTLREEPIILLQVLHFSFYFNKLTTSAINLHLIIILWKISWAVTIFLASLLFPIQQHILSRHYRANKLIIVLFPRSILILASISVKKIMMDTALNFHINNILVFQYFPLCCC